MAVYREVSFFLVHEHIISHATMTDLCLDPQSAALWLTVIATNSNKIKIGVSSVKPEAMQSWKGSTDCGHNLALSCNTEYLRSGVRHYPLRYMAAADLGHFDMSLM